MSQLRPTRLCLSRISLLLLSSFLSRVRRPELQRDDRAEVYIIIMLSGHKAGIETAGERDRKKRTTDSCAELCSTAGSGCGLSAGLRCVCCLRNTTGDGAHVSSGRGHSICPCIGNTMLKMICFMGMIIENLRQCQFSA